MATRPTYRTWLGGRTHSPALAERYRREYPDAGRASSSSSRPPSTASPTSPSRGSSGVPWDGGGDHRGLATGHTDPVTGKGSFGTSSGGRRTGAFGATDPARDLRTPSVTAPTRRGSSVPWDGGGDHRGLATGHTDPVKGKSSFGTSSGGRKTGAFPESNKPGVKWRTPASTPPSPTPPSGGERLVDGKTFAERAAANAAKRGAPAPSKIAQLGKAVGKVVRPVTKAINSPAGKMAGRVGLAYYGAKAAGDLFGLAEPYIDMARYGHQLPYKDGEGGRDNRLNDVLGNIPFNVREAMSPGQTQRDLSKLTGGISDKVFKTIFPYRERPTPVASSPSKPQRPATTAPTRPSAPAPRQPESLKGIGEQARGQSKALRNPDDYLGSAFDATLRKGIDTGRNYLQSQMNKDGLDSDTQRSIMERYNSKIAGDKELSKAANKGGIINTIEAKDPGRGQRTLEAYRGQRGTYQGNTSYKAMQDKYVK